MIADPRPRGKYLSHYTTLSKAVEYILPTGMLRLGSLGSVNDPRENKRKRFTGSWSSGVNEEIAPNLLWDINYLDVVDDLMRRFVKVACFTQDSSHCASEGIPSYKRSRMWAQYAENHRGVCLVFDREELNLLLKNSMPPEGQLRAASVHYINYSQDIFLALDPFIVSVDEVASKGLALYVKEMLERSWFDYFFVKMQGWRDESEFRFIMLSNDETSHYVKFESTLKGIIVGVGCPEAYEPSLRAIGEKLDVPCGRMKWRNGIPIAPSWNIHEPSNSINVPYAEETSPAVRE